MGSKVLLLGGWPAQSFDGSCRRRANINTDSTESVRLEQKQRSLDLACLCAKAADEFRGRETLVFDLTGITPVVDFFVVTTATSTRQMHAIAEESDRVLEARGSQRLGREGYESSTWILHDYGDIVLHVFLPETRTLYDLEHLWADAPHIDWQAEIEK